MATKMCFLTGDGAAFSERIIEFKYVNGLAFSQKQKNVLSFHSSIRSQYPDLKILEVSTKSYDPIGVSLSAFNLKLDGVPLESVFQSSKVFENNVQYGFLREYHPRDAKRYIADADHGALASFRYNGIEFPLTPRSLFYDFIYISALTRIPEISQHLAEYDIFTDIEFNEKKQYNSQARSCAIYAYMLRQGRVEYYLSSIENFKTLYSAGTGNSPEQITLF